MKHACAIARLKPELKKFGFPKNILEKSFLVTVSVFHFIKKTKLFFLMKAWPLFLFFFRLRSFLQPINPCLTVNSIHSSEKRKGNLSTVSKEEH